tara:strand:+ start:47 stop:919 length:873 start_codon:yes stop_codon:yes gene_type:complete
MSIKSIKEKELLVNFARQMGQEADPRLVEEVKQINSIKARVRESVSENLFKDLSDALKLSKTIPVYEPDDGPLTEEQIVQIKETIDYPKPPSLDDLLLLLGETKIEEETNELVQTQPEEKSPKTETTTVQSAREPVIEQTLADKTSEFISKSKDSFQQPDPLIVASDMDAVTKKLRFLEQWISKVSMAGPGGGAGSVAKLDHETKLITTPTYNISTKDYYLGVNYAGPVTITLPTIVNNGRMYIIKDESGICSTNPITVIGNVDNDPGGFILAQDNGGIQLIYRNGWRIV